MEVAQDIWLLHRGFFLHFQLCTIYSHAALHYNQACLITFNFCHEILSLLLKILRHFPPDSFFFFPPQIYLLPLEVEKSNFNHARNSSFQTSTCCSAYKTYMSGICNYHNSVSCHRNISALQHYRNRMTCIMKDFKIHPRHLFSSP